MTLLDQPDAGEAVGEEAYRRIRTDIVFGRLRPGQKLKLDGLKENYGVSISTLRRTPQPPRGGHFGGRRTAWLRGRPCLSHGAQRTGGTPDTSGGARDASIVANANVEWEGRVVSAHHKLASTERLMQSGIGEIEQWKRYDGEFHQALISNCGSRSLMEAHALVFDRYFRYQMIAFQYRGEEPCVQHKSLLDSALKRDAETAKETLITHVNNCVEHALATR